MTTGTLFFFYGTLMAGERNAAQLDGVRVLRRRPAHVRGVLVDCGRYPALLLPAPDRHHRVHGELVEIHMDEVVALCAHLDAFEGSIGPGHPQNLYERRQIAVTVDGDDGDGVEEVEAWVYVRPTPPTPADTAAIIAHGDWRRHRLPPP